MPAATISALTALVDGGVRPQGQNAPPVGRAIAEVVSTRRTAEIDRRVVERLRVVEIKSAAGLHDLNGGNINTSTNLGGVSFTTQTPRVAQDGAQITLALPLAQGDDTALRAEYDGDLRPGYASTSGLIKLEWKF